MTQSTDAPSDSRWTARQVHTKAQANTPISIKGLSEQPIINVTITNLTVDVYTGDRPPADVTSAEGIIFDNVTVNGKPVPSPH